MKYALISLIALVVSSARAQSHGPQSVSASCSVPARFVGTFAKACRGLTEALTRAPSETERLAGLRCRPDVSPTLNCARKLLRSWRRELRNLGAWTK